MIIEQFEDSNLAHYSYAILSEGNVAIIDPSRDPQPYYEFVKKHNARIVAIIETHPHADFVSSHTEIHRYTGVPIYISDKYDAAYEHVDLADEDTIKLGASTLKARFTPGHSPDSISIVAMDETMKEQAVFTGDSLFIGDCGRPDLREEKGDMQTQRHELAKQMYHTMQNVFRKMPDDVMVYPAHGAGSLCGKGLSDKNVSTIGTEKEGNWCMQEMNEDEFTSSLLEDQPFIPKYFKHDVATNKKGAADFYPSIAEVHKTNMLTDDDAIIIDTRPQATFKQGHMNGAINLMNGAKFETWLGSIVAPGEMFYLVAENTEELNSLIARTAKIGYEPQIKAAVAGDYGSATTQRLDLEHFKANPEAYTIVDIRNTSEVKEGKVFESAINIPLHELRERSGEVPTDKPIVVHCAGGYRSAAGSSIIEKNVNTTIAVYDLSDDISKFK